MWLASPPSGPGGTCCSLLPGLVCSCCWETRPPPSPSHKSQPAALQHPEPVPRAEGQLPSSAAQVPGASKEATRGCPSPSEAAQGSDAGDASAAVTWQSLILRTLRQAREPRAADQPLSPSGAGARSRAAPTRGGVRVRQQARPCSSNLHSSPVSLSRFITDPHEWLAGSHGK